MPYRCLANPTLLYWESKPYIEDATIDGPGRNGEGLSGHFIEAVNGLMSDCKCSIGRYVKHTIGLNPHEEVGKMLYEDVIAMPVTISPMKYSFLQQPDHTFVPILDSSNSVLFVRGGEVTMSLLLQLMSASWPILLIAMIAAGYAGIVVWLLDRIWNPTQFPKPFLTGSFEGFWFSIVTMTTVGYGDNTPLRTWSKVFCIVWILFGVCLMNSFYAVVTSSITASRLHSEPIAGKEVAVLVNSQEIEVALKKGAIVHEFDSIDDIKVNMTNMTQKHELSGILLERNVAEWARASLHKCDLFPVQTINHDAIIGFTMKTGDAALKDCVLRFARIRQIEYVKNLTMLHRKIKDHKLDEMFGRSVTVFQEDELRLAIMISGGGLIGLYLLLTAWEILWWRPRNHVKDRSCSLPNDAVDAKDADINNRTKTSETIYSNTQTEVMNQYIL